MKGTSLLAALWVCAIVFSGTLRADLPPGWEHMDVGVSPGLAGEASYDAETGVYTVIGDGETELWMPPADAVHFAFKVSSGDCEIIARVKGIEGVDDWAKAGVMIRETLDPDARCALVGLTAGGRTAFQHRKAPGEGLWSQHSRDPNAIAVPCWVRLVRERNTFTGYYSQDGENWIEHPNPWPTLPDANNPAKINMAHDALIGLFVTSQDTNERCKAEFDHVRVITPAGTALTYQGYLMDQGAPVNGPHDLRFTLYDTPVGGREVGDAYDANELDIVDGYLTTTVFFGGGSDVFNGAARWLEIAVKASGRPEAHSILEPRQRITPAPYAVYANKPVGPKGDPGPPGPKGEMPAHEWRDGQFWLRLQNPDGTWGQWVYLRGPQGPPGPVPDHRWDPATGCLQFEKPDGKWGDCIDINAIDVNVVDADWIIDGQNIYRMSGRVGILTSSPAHALDVAGQARFDGALFAYDATGIGFKDDSGALGVWVEHGGNVGIGTSDPAQKLDVNGQGRFDGTIYARDGSGIGFKDDSGILGLWVEDGGEVGIGTSAPTEELDVDGQGRFDGAIYARDSDGIGLLDDARNDGLWVRDGGNVGVGTRSPEVTLDIEGDERMSPSADGIVDIRLRGTGTRLMLDADEIQGWNRNQASPLYLNRLGGDLLLATGGGNLGIGTAGPKVDVAIGDPDTGLNWAGDGQLDIWSNNRKTVSVRPNAVGINMDRPTEALDVDGSARLRKLGTGSGTPVVVDNNGKLWKESSSRRYKADIRDLEPDPHAVLSLQPVRFQWKTTGQEEIGLIAEDVAEVAGDLVIYDAEGRPEGVKYGKLSLYLLSIVRAQQERIEALEQQVHGYQSLEQRVASLERVGGKKTGAAKESSDER